MSEENGSPQNPSTQTTTVPGGNGEKPSGDEMSGSSLGLVAIVIFGLLLVLFVAGIAATGEFATTGAPVAAPASGAGGVAPAAVQPLAAPANTAVGATTTNAAGATTYTVQQGDWLAAIARRYNTTVPAILAANPQITDSNSIQPGVTIVLP